MSAWIEVARIRRQQVLNLSITELMILLVFMAVTFSFLAKEEGLKDVPLAQKQIEELKDLNQSLRDQMAVLQQEHDRARADVEILKRQLRQLFSDAPPAPNPQIGDFIAVRKSELDDLNKGKSDLDGLKNGIADLKEINDNLKSDLDKQRTATQGLRSQIAELRKLLGGKAPGLPRCLVAGGFLSIVTLKSDGTMTVVSGSGDQPNPETAAIPGVTSLLSNQPLSASEFRKHASEINKWADAQEQPCRFSARVRHETMSVDQYDKNLKVVEQFFYVRRDN